MRSRDISQLDIPPDLALLKGIPTKKIPSVLHCLKARLSCFEPSEILNRPNSNPLTRYLVKGEAIIVCYDKNGVRSILDRLIARSVICSEIAPDLFSNNDVLVIACNSCTTIDFRITDDIESCVCCQKYVGQVRANMIVSLMDVNISLIKRLDALSSRSIRDKLLVFLQEQALVSQSLTFRIPFNRQELADYLYVDRSALCRELGKMQREDIITFRGSCFTLRQ